MVYHVTVICTQGRAIGVTAAQVHADCHASKQRENRSSHVTCIADRGGRRRVVKRVWARWTGVLTLVGWETCICASWSACVPYGRPALRLLRGLFGCRHLGRGGVSLLMRGESPIRSEGGALLCLEQNLNPGPPSSVIIKWYSRRSNRRHSRYYPGYQRPRVIRCSSEHLRALFSCVIRPPGAAARSIYSCTGSYMGS